MSLHLVIHGHFYQPPRENPWTGAIERQPSAAPSHDWNHRITEECYRPNAASRLLDQAGRIERIVNNYAWLSFNVGPTLLSWLAREAPDVVEALRQADRESLARLGHGNAMAQAYSHMILPLATPRDRWTQIRWGLAEFAARFGRPAEALWLAETGVDADTLRLLVRAGLRYLILAPSQAARWRRLGEERWLDAATAELDPRRPYRWRLRDEAGRPQGEQGIDICFYHPPLSRGISFQHYLRDAAFLADRIGEAGAGMADPLILVATDGEVFGHHERHGDMCLARLFGREAPRRGFQVTNLSAYLAAHRPAWEVELQPESAWSCTHGLGRWREHCGCSTGGGPGWSQAWRRPLRRGLDRLRDVLGEIFQEAGGALLQDPWAARDEYVELLLEPGESARSRFLARHQRHPLGPAEQVRALRLLEMQHQALLMYASCAWFFADVSGIETLQNLRHAARAIELAHPHAPLDLEGLLLHDLAQAASNLPEHRDGRRLWEREVRPARVSAEHAVARLMVEGLLGRAVAPQVRYRTALVPGPLAQAGGQLCAEVQAACQVTGEERRLVGVARREGPFDLLVGVAPWPGETAWEAFREEAERLFPPDREGREAWLGRRGIQVLRLADLPPGERRAILDDLLADTRANWERSVEALSRSSLPAALAMARAGTALPAWLRALLAEHWVHLVAAALAQAGAAPTPAVQAALVALGEQAALLGLAPDLARAAEGFGTGLLRRLEAIAGGEDPAPWQELAGALQLAAVLGLPLPERQLQDRLYPILRDRLPLLVERVQSPQDPAYPLVAALLAVATRLQFQTEPIRDRLRGVEEALAQDPASWP